jgi:hypothetical protein
MPSMTATPRKESEILRAILGYLALVPGVVAWRQNTGAMYGVHKGKRWAVRFGPRGAADITGWRTLSCYVALEGGFEVDPRPIAQRLEIEIKRPGAKLRPEQEAFLSQARKAGALAFVASSVADVQKVLPTPS